MAHKCGGIVEGELIHKSTEAMRKDNGETDDVDEGRMSYWGRMSVEGDSMGYSMGKLCWLVYHIL